MLIALLSSFTLTLLCYNQEADHFANLGADGIKKVTVENKRQRREVEGGARILGRWQKRDGTNGCGIVIKGVDRDKWITISKIVVPLAVCSALSARCYVFCLPLSVSVSLRPFWSALVLVCEAHVLVLLDFLILFHFLVRCLLSCFGFAFLYIFAFCVPLSVSTRC